MKQCTSSSHIQVEPENSDSIAERPRGHTEQELSQRDIALKSQITKTLNTSRVKLPRASHWTKSDSERAGDVAQVGEGSLSTDDALAPFPDMQKPSMVAHACNPSTWGGGRGPRVQGHS